MISPPHEYSELFDNSKPNKVKRESILSLLRRVENEGRELIPSPFFELKESDERWHIVAQDKDKNFYRSVVIRKDRTDEKRLIGIANGLLQDYFRKFNILRGQLHEFKGY